MYVLYLLLLLLDYWLVEVWNLELMLMQKR